MPVFKMPFLKQRSIQGNDASYRLTDPATIVALGSA